MFAISPIMVSKASRHVAQSSSTAAPHEMRYTRSMDGWQSIKGSFLILMLLDNTSVLYTAGNTLQSIDARKIALKGGHELKKGKEM
jgi:hypothetical protein